MEGLDVQQQSLLKKRRRNDLETKRKDNKRAQAKMAQVRQKKADEKLALAGGTKVLMPEVYVSNYMKQQRNYVKYKRFKSSHNPRNASDVADK